MPTTPASAGTTLALGAATMLYGAWSVVARRRGGDHWPLLVLGLALALSPWLPGFTAEPAAWIVDRRPRPVGDWSRAHPHRGAACGADDIADRTAPVYGADNLWAVLT